MIGNVRFTPKADMATAVQDVRFVPMADIPLYLVGMMSGDLLLGESQEPGCIIVKNVALLGFR